MGLMLTLHFCNTKFVWSLVIKTGGWPHVRGGLLHVDQLDSYMSRRDLVERHGSVELQKRQVRHVQIDNGTALFESSSRDKARNLFIDKRHTERKSRV
jgi:hypothetical protein